MPTRPPSTPPGLPGFEYVKLLGKGGFADVFLYQQLHPRRQVAVKVLLKDRVGTSTAEGFTEEANLMAQFATHPSIVSVYQAGLADDGRPYLVMEYCSRPNLQVRHRRERFSEVETLRVGIQIAGAVETAHRAGILHRDIKPANILVNDYGRPTLTDFGISAAVSGTMAGVSIPWAPPESLASPPQGFPSSDVYSLAATLYTLLTNRTPFEIAGASNTDIDVVGRIRSMPLPPVGRGDVSAALQAVLERAMAKEPAQRYASAIEFARALQRVQISHHGMQETPIDVLEEELVDEVDDDGEERTRFRNVTNIDAQEDLPPRPNTLPSVPAFMPEPVGSALPPAAESTLVRSATYEPAAARAVATAPSIPSAPPLESTVVRAPAIDASSAPPPDPAAGRRGRRTALWVSAAAVVVVVVGVGAAMLFAPAGVGEPGRETQTAAAPVDVDLGTSVPRVEDLDGVATQAGVVFSWTNPDPQDGDLYLWRPVVPGEDSAFEETPDATATIEADDSGDACIEVVLRRADGSAAADSVEGCAP